MEIFAASNSRLGLVAQCQYAPMNNDGKSDNSDNYPQLSRRRREGGEMRNDVNFDDYSGEKGSL